MRRSPTMIPDGPYAAGSFEVEQVTRWIRRQPASVYVEIGSYEGGSLRGFGGELPAGSTLVSIEKPRSSESLERLRGVAAKLKTDGFKVHLVLGNSRDAETIAAARVAIGSRPIDILFIDGDHTSLGVSSDIANYVPLVSNSGLVIMHDVGPCIYREPDSGEVASAGYRNVINVGAAWRDLGAKYSRKMIVQDGAGYGLIWMAP